MRSKCSDSASVRNANGSAEIDPERFEHGELNEAFVMNEEGMWRREDEEGGFRAINRNVNSCTRMIPTMAIDDADDYA